MLKKVGFYGLSHLGLCYSAAFAEKNFSVVAVDLDKKIIRNLKNGKSNIYEKNLEKIIINKNLNFSYKINDLNSCDIIFFSFDVKTDAKNISNINYIYKEILRLDKNLKKKIPIIILSQVHPGFTRSLKLKRTVYYQVETLIFGEALQRALKPERIILGKRDKDVKISRSILAIFKKFSSNIIQMNYESAELTKISINLMLISSIMTSNFISLYCEKIGANWHDIKYALQLDKRIGKFSYLNPSPGLSGGNLERDLVNSKRLFNYKKILNSWIDLDKKMKLWSLNIVKNNLSFNKKILICGLSYKKNTSSVKNSLSLMIIKKLKKNYTLNVLEQNKHIKLDEKIVIRRSYKNFKYKYDCVIFINDVFSPVVLKKLFKKNTIYIDPYGFFKKFLNKTKNKYFAIGSH